jgi:type II secretory pathway pseudopilin PulG
MSLLEVLVAMGLAGVLSTLLVSFFMTSQRVSLKELTRVSGREQLNSYLSLLQSDLRASSPDGTTVPEESDGHRLLVSQRNEGQSWSGQAFGYDFDPKKGILRRALLSEKAAPVLAGKFSVKSPLNLSKSELETLFGSQFPTQTRQFEMEDWKVEKPDQRTLKLSLKIHLGQASISLQSVACLRL